MKYPLQLLFLAMSLTLAGCGGSNNDGASVTDPDNSTDTGSPGDSTEETREEGTIYGPFSTGSTSAPAAVYFDLDTQSVIELTDEEAATDTTWDIAFQRTKIWLNTAQTTPVSVYFTNSNSDFYDEDGAPIADTFLNATADSELDDYTAITADSIPDDAEFISDQDDYVIGDSFYNYDMTTHVVSAADDVYYITYSDQNYTKFHVTNITTTGRLIGTITLGIEHQSVLDGASEFADEISLEVNATGCTDDMYVDFDTQQIVSASDDWDLSLSCNANSGADFSLTLADDATVLKTDADTYAGVDTEAAAYYGFSTDTIVRYAFDDPTWYYYDGSSHLLYSSFEVYVIQAGDKQFKLQITSYYDEDGTSGNYSFRTVPLTSEE